MSPSSSCAADSGLTRRACLRLISSGALLAGPPAVRAQSRPAAARVLLLGLFHFDNPGLDAVRYTPLDVMQPAAQADLEGLADRLARFAPTRVLLEYRAASDAAMNERYARYRQDRFELPNNEIYQVGFRVARRAGLAQVHGFDLDAPGASDALWKALPELPATQARLMARIQAESQRLQQAHRSLSLRELVALCNTPEADRRNKGFYMLLNDAGAGDGRFLGADASAHWWHRNLRMYAQLQQHAAAGERVLAIAGSGHTAILRDLLHADLDRVAEDLRSYL